MYRTLVILRHTFIEAIVQPIYPLLLAIGSAVILIFALLPDLGGITRALTQATPPAAEAEAHH